MIRYLLCVLAASAVQSLTTTDVENLKDLLTILVNTQDSDGERPLVAANVRLAFHDCVGGCDGCVDFSNADNAGLQTVVGLLDALYGDTSNGISALISRADFYALAGIVGVEVGASLQRRCGRNCVNPTPSVTFRYGRTDCDPATVATRSFPSGIANLTKTLQFFANEFSFTSRETVALLGAHTLGEAHRENSGFRGRWVPRKDSFDNDYFVKLADGGGVSWSQTSLQRGTLFQWDGDDASGRGHMMLNSDMVLYRDISPNATTGQTLTCPTNAALCPYAATKDIVEEFAADNAGWMAEFSVVFEKMIEHGSTNLQLPA
ncbi:putative ascorbate peroxidase [Lingula anatina]|uniref:Ascorbate peroxidase n=1 Tax=Lingula anatina TaxID=7574 RepID=A0A1S3JPX6_LINAN|nr:putative ascorbate peroxidase [Lingula anatina]|eukprot:XP_013412191.1 putative ascorbate peroxidase [Lingula anatina]